MSKPKFRKTTVAQLEAQRAKPSTEVLSDCAGLDQIPLSALQRIGTIFAEGERKYGRDNWRNDPGDVEYRRERTRHALRHFRRWIEETEGHRPATGEDHLAKVAWFCMTTIERERALALTEAE